MSRWLFALFFFLFVNCGSIQRMETSSTDTLSESAVELVGNSNLTQGEKKSLTEKIRILQSEIKSRDRRISELENEIEALGKQHLKLQDRFSEDQRDAGKGDGLRGLGYWILAIFGFIVVLSILYLVLKGKVRIPGFVG